MRTKFIICRTEYSVYPICDMRCRLLSPSLTLLMEQRHQQRMMWTGLASPRTWTLRTHLWSRPWWTWQTRLLMLALLFLVSRLPADHHPPDFTAILLKESLNRTEMRGSAVNFLTLDTWDRDMQVYLCVLSDAASHAEHHQCTSQPLTINDPFSCLVCLVQCLWDCDSYHYVAYLFQHHCVSFVIIMYCLFTQCVQESQHRQMERALPRVRHHCVWAHKKFW